MRVLLAGIEFPSPVGLAAGFDKNAEVPEQMLGLGFGFVEVGTVTPRPQQGNSKPRLFWVIMTERSSTEWASTMKASPPFTADCSAAPTRRA